VTTRYNVSDPRALSDAAKAFTAQAQQLAGEAEALTNVGADSVAKDLSTGDHDLDGMIGDKVDEIIEALAGEGERLQRISQNLRTTVLNYRATDSQVAGSMDAVY
jgi:hypothetical protein